MVLPSKNVQLYEFCCKYPESHQRLVQFVPLIKETDDAKTKYWVTYLFAWLDVGQLRDEAVLQKTVELSKNVRNLGKLSECEDGLVKGFYPLKRVHKAVLFAEVPFFRSLFRSRMQKDVKKDEVNTENYDCELPFFRCLLKNVQHDFPSKPYSQEDLDCLEFFATYLENTDTERAELLRSLDIKIDQAFNIMFLADYWGIEEIASFFDRRIAKLFKVDKALWDFFEKIDLSAFPYLNLRLFYCRYLSHFQKMNPYDVKIQKQVIGCMQFDENVKDIQKEPLTLTKENREFFETLPQSYAPKLAFVVEDPKDEKELEGLLELAKKFRSQKLSRYLLRLRFERKAQLEGIVAKRAARKKRWLMPCDKHLLREEIDPAACPFGGKIILEPEKISVNFLEFLGKHCDVPIGLTLKVSEIENFAERVKSYKTALKSIKMLNFVADNPNQKIDSVALSMIVKNLRNLKVLVIPEEVKELFPKTGGLKELAKAFSLWKNLTGTKELGEVDVFNQQWLKLPEVYSPEELED